VKAEQNGHFEGQQLTLAGMDTLNGLNKGAEMLKAVI
jgi:hypothetical protein